MQMAEGLDWLYRPVLRGLCRAESLKDGSLDMCDIAELNEAIDVEETNKYLIHEKLKQQNS